MEIYKHLRSTVSHNGKKILCDMYDWAQFTLSGSRLEQFNEEIVEIGQFLLNSGKFTTEPIYSQAVDKLGNKIVIGERLIFDDEYFAHPKYGYWQNEFATAENVVVYRALVKEL